ncbi:hypothetical protein G7Y89_g74 [Cudoniella acicularis]|uniref:Uncharacterized protein n=1 Tax=Cudoniella acicularis TaxID=354080 RepID=A0A8H4WBI3_9HELO|nr:hypothetical protein G7Y89_g74 [Cudoniella acicularis]
MPQLRFITTTNPEQVKGSGMRKIVRSHVARQHHIVRQQAWRDDNEVQGKCEYIPTLLKYLGLRGFFGDFLARMILGDETGNSVAQDKTPSEPSTRSQQSLRRPSGSLVITVSPGGAEPFSVWPLEATPRMNILVDHFLKVVGPGMNAFIAGATGTVDPIKTVYIPFSMSDPCVFHGLLLLSARSFAKLSLDTSYHITALKHKVGCIHLVNQGLGIPGKQTSDAIIAAVLMLAVEEMLLGDPEVFKAHLKGLQSMVVIRGGLDKLGLGGILKQLALSCDRACGIFTGSEPLFGQRDSREIIPPGFDQILQCSEINHHVSRFISDAKITTMIKTFSGYEGMTDAELLSSDTHCNFIAQHINRISSQSMITNNIAVVTPHLRVEECLCYGLMTYHIMMLRSIPPHPSLCLDIGNQLKSALLQTELQVHWQGHSELLLWISFAGAHTTTQGPLRDWYVLLLSSINSRLGAKSWEQIKPILMKFLWIERYEIPGSALWLEMEHLSVNNVLHLVTLAPLFRV